MNLRSGDEISVVAFLGNEIESLFGHLQQFSPDVQRRVDAYRSALDPRLGTVYRSARRSRKA